MIYQSENLIKTPAVSVCIVTYNQEIYIAEAIEGALNQEINSPYEIIIGEDKSTDGTLDICLNYQRKYPDKIIVVANEENYGLLKNLFNLICTIARGKYIALCGGDDVWISPQKLFLQYNILENNNLISYVHSGFNYFNNETKESMPLTKWKSPLLHAYGKKALRYALLEKFSNYPLASSAMFRKCVIHKYLAKNPLLILDRKAFGEGMIIMSICSLEGTFKFIPEILVNYRILENSMSHLTSAEKTFVFKLRYQIQKAFIACTLSKDFYLISKVNRQLIPICGIAIENDFLPLFQEYYIPYLKSCYLFIPRWIKISLKILLKNKRCSLVPCILYNRIIKVNNNVLRLKNKIVSF